jgi:phosphatidylethanolamine-binding protein (PEBP) family uncharacterized protein
MEDIMKSGLIVLGMVSAVILSGCQSTKDAANLATLGVEFSWTAKHKCSSTSPAFKISGVPAGTKTLKFWMTDLQVPTFTHGGGSVAYSGSGDIPEGAFSYTGPCPPSGSHDYEFEVTAINEAGDTALGRGKSVKPFPPK